MRLISSGTAPLIGPPHSEELVHDSFKEVPHRFVDFGSAAPDPKEQPAHNPSTCLDHGGLGMFGRTRSHEKRPGSVSSSLAGVLPAAREPRRRPGSSFASLRPFGYEVQLGRDVHGTADRAGHRALARVVLVGPFDHSTHRRAHRRIHAERVANVDAPQHDDAVLRPFHLAGDVGNEPPITSRHPARLQRAPQGPGQSAACSGHHVIEGRGMGVVLAGPLPIVLGDLVVDPEEHLAVDRKGRAPDAAAEPLDPDPRRVDDIGQCRPSIHPAALEGAMPMEGTRGCVTGASQEECRRPEWEGCCFRSKATSWAIEIEGREGDPRTTLSFSGALIGLLTETCRDHRRVLGQSANGCPLGIPYWPSSPCRGFSGLGPIGPMVLGA
jgi:hypothetical protein